MQSNKHADQDAIYSIDVGDTTKHLLVTFTLTPKNMWRTSPLFATMGIALPGGIAARKTIQIAKYGTSWVTVHSTCATQTLSQTFNTTFQLSTLSSQMVNMPSSGQIRRHKQTLVWL